MEGDDSREGSRVNGEVFVVSTGGTFEKVYNSVDENFDFLAASCVPEILERARVFRVKFYSLVQKDSELLNESDLASLRKTLIEQDASRFVVVHGTTKLVDTAQFLSNSVPGKVVVLLGAMKPFLYDPVEASFNLGYGIACARTMPCGVWVAMNGVLFTPENCVKNRRAGLFEELA